MGCRKAAFLVAKSYSFRKFPVAQLIFQMLNCIIMSQNDMIKGKRMNKEQFGILLTALRKKRGMNQKELADILSVSTSAVSKWEHGKNLPDMTMLNKIAEIFQVSCDDLHNPEKTLLKLQNPELQDKEMAEEQKDVVAEIEETSMKPQRHKIIVCIAVVVGILAVAAGLFLFYMNQSGLHIRQVGARYIEDPNWGRVYEIACVVDGEISYELTSLHMNEMRFELKKDERIDSDMVKINYYGNRQDAVEWKVPEYMGYFFLNVE